MTHALIAPDAAATDSHATMRRRARLDPRRFVWAGARVADGVLHRINREGKAGCGANPSRPYEWLGDLHTLYGVPWCPGCWPAREVTV